MILYYIVFITKIWVNDKKIVKNNNFKQICLDKKKNKFVGLADIRRFKLVVHIYPTSIVCIRYVLKKLNYTHYATCQAEQNLLFLNQILQSYWSQPKTTIKFLKMIK